MALSIELKRRLNNIDEPLPKRIRLAENIFNSQRFPLTTRRSIILQWICDLDSSQLEDSTWIEPLKKCFTVAFANSDVDIPVKQNLIAILQTKLSTPTIEVLECLIYVLTHASMQQYFITNLKTLRNVLRVLLISINNLYDENDSTKNDILKNHLKTVMKHILEHYKSCVDAEAFYSSILDEMLREIFVSLHIFKDNTSNEICNDLIRQCIFTKDNTDPIKQYIEFLKNMETECMPLCIEILTTAFVNSYKENPNIIFKLYRNLFEMKDNSFELSLRHLAILIDILKNENVSLDSQDDGESFLVFLQKYGVALCTLEHTFENKLSVLTSLLMLNPLIIEAHIKEILVNIMLIHKPCLESYTKFLQIFIQSLIKLNRVHKLPSLMLEELDASLQMKYALEDSENNVDQKEIENVWPLGAGETWGKAMKGLNANVTWATLKTLIYNLENRCIVNLRTLSNIHGTILTTQVTLRFIDNFIDNFELPIMSQANFTKVNDHIREIFEALSKIAAIIIEKNLYCLLLNWLHTAYKIGEFSLMVNYYWQFLSSQINNNLIGNYLHKKIWKKIGKLIEGYECLESKKYLNQISLQKKRSGCINLETDRELPSISNSTIEASLANWDEFLCSKIIFNTTHPFMTDTQTVQFITDIIKNLISSKNLHILAIEHIQENKKFMSILLFCIFEEIAKCFLENKKSLTKGIFEEFSVPEILENKTTFLEHLCKDINESDNINVKEVDSELLFSCFNALKVMKICYLEPIDKVCSYVFISSVIGDLKTLSKTSDEIDIKPIEDILLGLLESGPTFCADEYFSDITYLKLSNWFSEALPLMYPLIEMSVKQSSQVIVDKFKTIVKNLSKKCIVISEIKELTKLREIATMPTIILIVMRKMKKNLPVDSRTKVSKLQNKCLNLINDIINKCPSEHTDQFISFLLPSYVFLLQSFIKNTETRDQIENVPKILKNYIDYALRNLNQPKYESVQSLITIVIRNQSDLKDYIPEKFISNLWNICYNLNSNSKNPEYTISLLENCNDKQFEKVILDLAQNTCNSLTSTEQLPNCINLWINVSEVKLSTSKSKIRLDALIKLSQELLQIISKWQANEMTIIMIFKFYYAVINNHLLILNSTAIDVILGAVLLIPFDEQSSNSKIELYRISCSIIQVALLKRTAMILDRLPIITQDVRCLIKVLCQWSSLGDFNLQKNIDSMKRKVLSDLGHSVEKIFVALIKLKRDLSRPAYLIHDLIVEFTSHTLLPEVKQSLLNCCYLLHSLCDSHALKYLNTVSNPANRQIFKNIHDAYNKFHMFKGKI